MFAGEIHHLRDLRLCNLIRENATFADAVLMHMQHDSAGFFPSLAEEPFQDVNDKLHRGVVVVQQQHTVEIGPLGLRLGLGEDRGSRPLAVALACAVVLTHPVHRHMGAGIQ